MKGAEETFQVSKEHSERAYLYKESLEKMNGVLFILDYNNIGFSWTGKNFEEITGYKIEEVENLGIKGLKGIYHPDDFHFFSESYIYFVDPETREKSHTAVYRIKHNRGHYIWVYFSSFVISRNHDGTPTKVSGIMINLDEFMLAPYFEKQIIEQGTQKNNTILKALSKREKEILSFLTKGLSAAQLAVKFELSKRTIESHKRNIQKKTRTQ